MIQECVFAHIAELQYAFATIFGEAESFRRYRESPSIEDKNILDESRDFLHWMRKISARYVGSEKADMYAKRNTTDGAGRYKMKPRRVVSEKIIADW